MALSEYKISEQDIRDNGVQSAPDKLTGTAAENKAVFDRFIQAILRERMNELIDALETELAGKMTAPETEGAAGQFLKTDGAGGRSWDTPEGSGDMLRAVYDTDFDGRVDEAQEALSCTGNAATATRLKTSRAIKISDASGINTGASVSFDGSSAITIKLPETIKADVEGSVNGEAATAKKLAAKRTMLIKDSDAHTGASVNFDGSANVELPLPSTIRANIRAGTIVLDSGSYGTSLPLAGTAGRLFFKKA